MRTGIAAASFFKSYWSVTVAYLILVVSVVCLSEEPTTGFSSSTTTEFSAVSDVKVDETNELSSRDRDGGSATVLIISGCNNISGDNIYNRGLLAISTDYAQCVGEVLSIDSDQLVSHQCAEEFCSDCIITDLNQQQRNCHTCCCAENVVLSR